MKQIKHKDENIIETFKSRDGLETKVELKNGKQLIVWNIAWGYNMGDDYAHITTNISPNVDKGSIDFFYTNEIAKIYTDNK